MKTQATKKGDGVSKEDIGDLFDTFQFMIRRLKAREDHPGKLDLGRVKREMQKIIFDTGRVTTWKDRLVSVHIYPFMDVTELKRDLCALAEQHGDNLFLNTERSVNNRLSELLSPEHLERLEISDQVYTLDTFSLTPRDLGFRKNEPSPDLATVIHRAEGLGLEALRPEEAPQALLRYFASRPKEQEKDLTAAMLPVSLSDTEVAVFRITTGLTPRKAEGDFYELQAPFQLGTFIVQIQQQLLFKKRKL